MLSSLHLLLALLALLLSLSSEYLMSSPLSSMIGALA